ncbi:MAG: DUF6531 domain-containing protein, partial [Acidimicrobiales bacterium]
ASKAQSAFVATNRVAPTSPYLSITTGAHHLVVPAVLPNGALPSLPSLGVQSSLLASVLDPVVGAVGSLLGAVGSLVSDDHTLSGSGSPAGFATAYDLATAATTAPGAPTDVVATPGDGASAVTWSAPVDDGGATITSYVLSTTGTNAPAAMTMECGGASSCTSAEIGGLGAGNSYTFSVQADNGGLGAVGSTTATIPALTGNTGPYDIDSQALGTTASVGLNLANGDLVVSSTDLSIAGVGLPVSLTRTYNSQSASASSVGAFGVGNASTIGPDVSLSVSVGGAVTYHAPDGSTDVFAPEPSGSFNGPPDLEASLTTAADGDYALVLEPSGDVKHFNSGGLLTSETDPNANAITYAYGANGTLSSITDTQGRVINLTESAGLITSLTDPTGRVWSYAYNSSGELSTFTDPMGTTTSYGYDPSGQLTTITDPDGDVTSVTYASAGVVASITYGYGSPYAATTSFGYYGPGATACGQTSGGQACT